MNYNYDEEIRGKYKNWEFWAFYQENFLPNETLL